MTINPLTMRLKAIKRELLALKTSHTKSASLLKVFSATSFVPLHDNDYTLARIIIKFSEDYGAFPYFRVEIEPTGFPAYNYGSNIYIGTEAYDSTGYRLEVEIAQLGIPGYSNNFKVTSTSPITSISYEWV